MTRSLFLIIGNVSKTADCSNVKCVPVKPANCRPIIPPGGCCPVCGKCYTTDFMVCTNITKSISAQINT